MIPSLPTIIGTFPTATDHESLELLLGGQKRFDHLEAGFDAFLQREDKVHSFLEDPTAKTFLQLVHLYLRHCRTEREAIFDGTSLQKSNCLVKGLMAADLCWRKGIVATVARPDSRLRYYHAVVAYQSEHEERCAYHINGSSAHQRYFILSQREILLRLHLIDLFPNFFFKTAFSR